MVRRANTGFTYLTALFIVAVLMGGLALIGEMWETSAKREKEAELLFIGNEYRKAVMRYYLAGPRQYPKNLSDLIKDPRQPGTVRHLRRLYPDPVTGKSEWGFDKSPDGGFAGVHSLSEDQPLKSGNFKLRDAGFESAQKYSDWKFIYTPGATTGAPKPAPKPAT